MGPRRRAPSIWAAGGGGTALAHRPEQPVRQPDLLAGNGSFIPTTSRTRDASQFSFLSALSCPPARVLAAAGAHLLGVRVPHRAGRRARLCVPEPPPGTNPGRLGRGPLLRAHRGGDQES